MTYFIYDIESGEPTEVTKEQYDSYQATIKACMPKVEGVGKIVVFGTGGSIEDHTRIEFLNYQGWGGKNAK